MSIQHWAYDGVTLDVDDHGKVSLEDLKDLVTHVERMGEGTTIRVHRYGLRAVRIVGEGGPHLDWRD